VGGEWRERRGERDKKAMRKPLMIHLDRRKEEGGGGVYVCVGRGGGWGDA
jgi:hypothetical protein